MRKSDKFGFDAEIVTPRERIAAQHADLKWFGLLGAGVLLIAATGIAVLMPRGTPRNPMAEIEHALEAGEFVPYYQPIVDIRTGRVRGAEVLAALAQAGRDAGLAGRVHSTDGIERPDPRP